MARLAHLTGRGLETQRVLSEALFQLITEKEYAKISIKDITERAHIDRTTFYLHFKDKDDLFLKSQQQLIDEVFSYEGTLESPYPRATLAFAKLAVHPKAGQVLLGLSGDSYFAQQMQVYLSKWLRPLIEDEFHRERKALSDLDFELLLGYMGGAMRGMARCWLEKGMPLSAEEMAQRYMQMTIKGIHSGLFSRQEG